MVKYELDKTKLADYLKKNKCSEEEVGRAINGLAAILSEKYYITSDKNTIPNLIIMTTRGPLTPEQQKADFERITTINLNHK